MTVLLIRLRPGPGNRGMTIRLRPGPEGVA